MSEATLPEPVDQENTEAVDDGSRCEKCGVASASAACPACGWYPVLGVHVEIDSEYEACMGTVAPEKPEAAEPKADSLSKHLEVWRGLIPGWAWLMIGTVAVIFAAGVAARVATLSNPTLQTYIGVGSLLTGLATLLVTHVVGFVLISFEDANTSVTDLVIKPIKSWAKLASQLPERLWVANTGVAALTTALTAALVVGGIPYERLLDWNFKAPPKQNLVGMIADQASQMGGDKHGSLEDSVNDFASQAGDLEGDGKPTPPAAKPRHKLDCLVIGYRLTSQGDLDTLLLAAGGTDNKLRYVGGIRPGLDADEAAALLKKFERIGSTRPFVKTQVSGQWVQPKHTCRITYTEWRPGSRPRDIKWDQMLDEVKMPW